MKVALRYFFLFACFAFSSQSSFSQKNMLKNYDKEFAKIDSLARIAQAEKAIPILEQLSSRARTEGNTTLLIKSVLYRMLFESYLEEDAFGPILTDLKKDIKLAKQPEKSILQSLLAEMYWKYYEHNRYKISNRTNVAQQLSDDISTWSIREITNESAKTFLHSLSERELLQKIKIGALNDILLGDTSNRHLRPSLYDLLVHRALDVFVNTQVDISNTDTDAIDFNDPQLLADYKTFSALKFPQADSTYFPAEALNIFKQLLQYHEQQKNTAALADADLKRLKFIYQRSSDEQKSKLYLSSLQALAKTAENTEIYADILVEQAQLYKNEIRETDSSKFDLSKAVQIAEQAIKAFPDSKGAADAANLIKTIKQEELNVKLKQTNLPEKPIQALLTYKNIDKVIFRIYKLSFNNKNAFQYFNSKEDYQKFIKKHKLFREQTVQLPFQQDYQQHTLSDQIEALPKGDYILFAQNTADIDQDKFTNSYTQFKVSSIQVVKRGINADSTQYMVFHSGNGKPVEGASIQTKHNPEKQGANTEVNGQLLKTDKNGNAVLKYTSRIKRVLVSYQGDTIETDAYNYNYQYEIQPGKVILFTDRGIYRPGQTVFYKGIFLEDNDKKSNIQTGKSLEVNFTDVNGDQIGKANVMTNEYGTFQGSFPIPMGKMNGSMELSTTYGQISIQVEEYKRPTFEVLFDKPIQKYRLQDSIRIKGKAIGFAGYAISKAKVKYSVFRQMSGNPAIYGSRYLQAPKQVAIGKTETEADGSFSFSFFAAASQQGNDTYRYLLKAEITDINGETRTGEKEINAGKKDIALNVELPEQLFLTTKPDSIAFQVTNLNGEPIRAKLEAEWFLLKTPGRLPEKNQFGIIPEQYTLSKEKFIRTFPNEAYAGDDDPANWQAVKTNLQQQISADQGAGKLEVSPKDLQAGYYKVKFSAVNEDKERITLDKIVRIYPREASTILAEREWLVAEKTNLLPKETAIFRLAGLQEGSKAYYEVYYKDHIVDKVWITNSPKQSIITITPKAEWNDSFAVQFFRTENGLAYSYLQNIRILDPAKELDIKFLTFRDKLQPGEKESWKLSISSKTGEKQMAELVATLYDASLDELKKMEWTVPALRNYNYNLYDWQFNFNPLSSGEEFWFTRRYRDHFSREARAYEQLNLFGYGYYGNYNEGYRNYLSRLERKERSAKGIKKLANLQKGKLVYGVVTDEDGFGLAGVNVKKGKTTTFTDEDGIYKIDAKQGEEITFQFIGFNSISKKVGTKTRLDVRLKSDRNGLNEVVVAAASVKNEGAFASESLQMRGVTTLQKSRGYKGAPSPVAADALSTDRDETTPIDQDDPKAVENKSDRKAVSGLAQPSPRTNFNETAFFFPQLQTNKEGEIQIDFTIPQSLTRYKMWGFAHTKDLKMATVSNELLTQKQLAISANAPRFFREGDTLVFSAKLNNLSGKLLKGNAMLELRDALTNQVIHIFSTGTTAGQSFEISDKGNEVLKWSLEIPSGYSAISYKVLAQSGKYSDGEEMTIPVLPNGMLVTETMPLNVRGNTSKTFNMQKLLQSGSSNTLKNQRLTLEFSSNPVWYAIQALPYLMEYPYECAEQTFSRFYGNSFASGIINSSPKIKQVFNRWQQAKDGRALLSNLEKNPELKSILLEETPWVRDAHGEAERKKRLSALFDLNRMTYELKSNFEKLEKMQNANGSFPWFSGMNEDRFITQHIVAGMGQLKHLKMVDEAAYPGFQEMLNKAIIYLDAKLKSDYKDEISGKGNAHLPLHYLYARSYTDQKNNDPVFKKAFDYYLNKIKTNWRKADTYQQGQSALVLARNGNKAEALTIISFLKESAHKNEEMGMYWDNNRSGWWWYESPIETQSLLVEVFDEIANDAGSVEEMKIWLLKNKQTNDWKTTKATAAACYALLLRGTSMLEESASPEISIGNQTLAALGLDKTEKEAGTGYQKISIEGNQVTPEMGKVEVKNNNKTIAWGGIYWQYFEQLDKITSAETGVKIKKQLFLKKQTNKGDLLTALSPTNVLTPGDRIKVRIEIRADRDMEYVHLKDMRSAGFEPLNVISGYKYQDGLGYYESTKDASTNFFISYLRKGVYVFEYELGVSLSGNFSNGITTLQCMYAPEFSTHSEGIRVTVK